MLNSYTHDIFRSNQFHNCKAKLGGKFRELFILHISSSTSFCEQPYFVVNCQDFHVSQVGVWFLLRVLFPISTRHYRQRKAVWIFTMHQSDAYCDWSSTIFKLCKNNSLESLQNFDFDDLVLDDRFSWQNTLYIKFDGYFILRGLFNGNKLLGATEKTSNQIEHVLAVFVSF